jgi:indole-3-glycerol phosphate synthase
VAAIKGLKPHGFQGFLIGESFMKTDNPGESAKEFIKKLNA